MKIRGSINDLQLSFDGKQRLVLSLVDDFRPLYDELNGKDLIIELKEYKERRSLNANAYAWVLINEIANRLNTSKEAVYFDMLRHYGKSQVISVVADVDLTNFVRYFEEFGESELNGKLFKHYKVYKGSSEYDTAEMSTLINGIVYEAKDLGIQTEAQNEINRMINSWR